MEGASGFLYALAPFLLFRSHWSLDLLLIVRICLLVFLSFWLFSSTLSYLFSLFKRILIIEPFSVYTFPSLYPLAQH